MFYTTNKNMGIFGFGCLLWFYILEAFFPTTSFIIGFVTLLMAAYGLFHLAPPPPPPRSSRSAPLPSKVIFLYSAMEELREWLNATVYASLLMAVVNILPNTIIAWVVCLMCGGVALLLFGGLLYTVYNEGDALGPILTVAYVALLCCMI